MTWRECTDRAVGEADEEQDAGPPGRDVPCLRVTHDSALLEVADGAAHDNGQEVWAAQLRKRAKSARSYHDARGRTGITRIRFTRINLDIIKPITSKSALPITPE
ncbi:hypothetical protein MRX96_040491 [Rhipicephalus microplus]